MINKWNFRTPTDEELHKRDRLAADLGISPVISLLLVQRGITSAEEAKRFFKPSLSDLHDPFLMPDMEKAASIKVSETPRELNIPVQPRMVSPNTQIPQTPPTIENAPQCADNQRKITKIVVFYDDNTFIEIK